MSGARANLFLNRRAACFELVTICLIIVSSLQYHPRATSVSQLRGTRSSSSRLHLHTPIEKIDDAVSSLLPAVRRLPPYDYATVERHNTMIEIFRHRHRLDFVLIVPWPLCHLSLGSAGPTHTDFRNTATASRGIISMSEEMASSCRDFRNLSISCGHITPNAANHVRDSRF